MTARFLLPALAVSLGLGVPALATGYQSELVFELRQWKVEMVAWDDGTLACQGSVGNADDSFSIWTFDNGTVHLQFWSSGWDFGNDGQTADLVLQIDKKGPWTLNDADLYMNSVRFTLPTGDSSGAVERLLGEVSAGNTLFLRSGDGKDVSSFSLSGSSASIRKLAECGEVFATPSAPPPAKGGGGGSRNPFN